MAEWHPGPLVPWGDVDALASRLREALEEPRPRLVDRSRERMDELDRVYELALASA